MSERRVRFSWLALKIRMQLRIFSVLTAVMFGVLIFDLVMGRMHFRLIPGKGGLDTASRPEPFA